MNSIDILNQIRLKQAENNIKYFNTCNSKEEIKKTNLCLMTSQEIESLPSAPLGITCGETAVEGSAKKPKLHMATPDINYAKVSVQKPARDNSKRRKINLDINVKNNAELKKITFASTDKLWEWQRDIKRDYANGEITEPEYLWYMERVKDFEQIKQATGFNPLIGKGNRRGEKNTIRYTTAIYAGSKAYVWLGEWHCEFDLEVPSTVRAQKYTDYIGEYRDTRRPYVEMEWL
jgi:hypothetical protein